MINDKEEYRRYQRYEIYLNHIINRASKCWRQWAKGSYVEADVPLAATTARHRDVNCGSRSSTKTERAKENNGIIFATTNLPQA